VIERPPEPLTFLVRPEARQTGAGIWLGLVVASLLLFQTGTPPTAVVLCMILVTGTLLVSLRWRIGLVAIAVLVVAGVILRFDMQGRAFSDVLTVTRAAIDQMLGGGNPYGHGFVESNPAGAPFAYGPLALIWYLPVRTEPYRLELAISILVLAALALRGRMLGLAIFATLPPLIVVSSDGSNDTSAGLLLLIALLLAPRIPWAGSVALAVAAAFKPYALAWLVPLVPYAGASMLIPFAAATIVIWGPALIIWGPDNILWSLRQADAIHRSAYYALAYAIGDNARIPERIYSVFRFVAGGLVAVATVSLVRSSRGLIMAGVAIFLATLFLGWWSTFAYVAAIAPILCWHLDDWLGLPRVVWPADPVGAITRAVDRRWPVLRPGTDVVPQRPAGPFAA
jgi:hypothetical protein